MVRKWLALAFISAAVGLTACNRDDRSPVQVNPEGVRGSARIALPQLPPGFLVDSSQKALFALDIVGPDRDTIRRSTYILPGQPSHILFVDGIPLGLNHFYGKLYRVDSAGGSAEQTHAGSDSAVITSDREAQVHLFLYQFTGSAEVCVQVQGWETDSSCLVLPPPPPPPPPPETLSVAGCYVLKVVAERPAPGHDSVSFGRLEIFQRDTNLIGIVTWSSGKDDTVQGTLLGYIVRLGGVNQPVGFSAIKDSAGVLTGNFHDSLRQISGYAYALPQTYPQRSCLADSLPPPPPPTQRDCYAFKETHADGKKVTGRMALEFPPGYFSILTNTYVHWDGIGFRAGWALMTGSPDSTASLDWHFTPPAGLFSGIPVTDSVSIRARLTARNGTGQIQVFGQPAGSLGTWTGTPTACRDSDFIP